MSYSCELIKKQSGTLYANTVLAGGVSLVKMHGNPKRLYCPHCGKINDKEETKDEVHVQE